MVRLKNLLTVFVFFFFNDTATTEIYTLSLHDALPISLGGDDGRTVGGEIEVAPSRGRFAEAAGLPVQRDRVEREARLLQHGRDQPLAVAAPGKARDIVGADVDGRDPARLPILDLQLPLIGFVPVSRLRGPGEVAAVGRRPGLRVIAVVVRGEIARRTALAVDEPEVAVGAA